jgi:transketolase
MSSVDQICINTIRFLAIDAVEKAKSGHPGMPMGAAPMAYVLWDRFLKHNPKNPKWFDRDRFILSAGHGSMLLYSLLHLYGYDVSLEDLKNFRQWGSKTPGHPEFGDTPGVEVTTGPLGQGFAMGVGMAIAEAFLAATFNVAGEPAIVDHFTYGIISDGDLMEGVASEAASLAGHLGLGKLVYLYDDNHISIDGDTELAFTESVPSRFEAYGWHVQSVEDGNDLDRIEAAIRAAREDTARPSLICVRTHIGYGSPKEDSERAHGEALGEEAVIATREKLKWTNKPFHVPSESQKHCREATARGEKLEREWEERLADFAKRHGDKAEGLRDAIEGRLPKGWESALPSFSASDGPMATRKASGVVLNQLAPIVPTLMGGSADLTGSNNTFIKGAEPFSLKERDGRNFHFGVREHAMGAALNGMALHGAVVPYGGTFLIFSDYMRPAIRLAALQPAHSIFVFTHDSIGLGEDGPTHQPIEQLLSLRAIPGLTVVRPADANETAAAWGLALSRSGPVALALTRQGLPVLEGPIAEGVPKGAYILSEAPSGAPEVVLAATGSEVSLALEAQRAMAGDGVEARVVSMPSWELFDEQPEAYRREVLPPGIPTLAIEAGSPRGWRDYVGENGVIIGLNRFGASAPGKVAMEKLGFTVERVVAETKSLMGRS